nr:reverse transcriptase domain-containing protein [Tanacetum cinerariifolium]
MADNRTMKELLQAPTEGYGEAIVIPKINANHFEIKTNLLQLVQANPYHGFERENPHTHINNFKRINLTLKFRDVPNDVIKLVMFPYSLDGNARVWYDKEHPNSILTWEDLVNKFVNQFFPPSKTTHLKNEISRENLLTKTTREALQIIENKSKVCYSINKPNVSRMNTNSKENASKSDDRIDKLADQISTLVDIFDKKIVAPASVKAVEESCVIVVELMLIIIVQIPIAINQVFVLRRNQSSTSGTLLSNTIPNSKGEMKSITTRSGVAYEGPWIPTPKKVVERETEETTDKEQLNFQGSTDHIQPSITQIPKPNVPNTLSKLNIPYPSRLNDQKLREKATNQMDKFFQIFQDLHFDISFADALILMPKFASTIKSLLTNKDKLFELAKIPLNENCSAILLKKLPEKLRDPGKFLIPCDFLGIDVCHALTNLGASINLMPLFIWKKLSQPELTPTRMTLELADRSITRPKGVTGDVFVKVGKFHFLTDFVVVDFEADPRVPLILGRSFLRIGRALIDVYGEEITLRVNDESVTFNLNQTTRYSYTYDDLSVNRIDIIDVAREEYAQEFVGFSSNSSGGNPTSTFEPILSYSSLSLTSFEGSDFILEEINAYLKDESVSPENDHADCDPEGDICLIEKLLNDDPFQLPPMDLKQREGIDPRFCTHKILMEEDYKPAVQSQRRVNPKIHELIKKEVIKLLDAGMIYPISDSPWVSPIHCVPKKCGITVVENENNELIHTRLVTRWRVCIDYRKLNDATRKDHFPLFFMDQMLERLAGNEFYCFLDGFSGYFQNPINPPDQENTTFTYPYGTFAYRRMPFGLCNAPRTFQRCMMAIFHDMIEKTMKVFMDDLLIFGDSFSSCLSYLDTMLQMCEDTNLVLNWEKCHFMVKEGIVLGHKISKNGLEVDRSKVDVIAKSPYPTTVKETPFVFSNDCIDAFETLKKKLTEAPILVVPDWNLPFELMCDASHFAIGVILRQRKTKHFQPIHYASKTIIKAQIHYTVTEKEIIAVVYAFEKFRPYLVLSKSIVYTDHSAPKYLLSKQDAKPRLIRNPRAIISDRGTHFCNDKFAKVMSKYGVTHRLSTAYHPQTSGQVEVSNRGLKRILERTVRENHASWSEKLDDALWAFRTAYKTPIGCTPYKLVYGKSCHLPIELKHKAYWALKHVNFDHKTAEKTKKIHDSKIKNRIFNVGDWVLLFNSRLKVNGHRVKHYFGGDVPQLVVPHLQTFPMENECRDRVKLM